jgi:poly(3-hydroxybutyrate) depolymerase
MRFELVFAAVTLAAVAAPRAEAEMIEAHRSIAGTTVQYKVVLPNGFDPAQAYPAILVFGGGPQTMNTVEGTLSRNFRAEAEKRGYIVVAPAAPGGDLFFQGGERIFPAFLDAVRADYKIRGGKFHVAGPSNGGIAAFHVAAAHPDDFLSVTAFPGYLWQPSAAKLNAIANLCVFAYVGENDEYRWHDEMKREVDYLTGLGTLAHYSVEAGQPHRLATLADANAGRLFDGFAAAEKGCHK